MFKVKCIEFQDKYGKPYRYQFRAKSMPYISFIILTIVCIFVGLYLPKYYSNPNIIIIMFSMATIASFICFCLSCIHPFTISITISLDSMIHEHGKIVISHYFSKNIWDDTVKFLTELSVTELSQKSEESS